MLQWHQEKVGFGVIVIDHYSIFFNVTIAGIGILTMLLSVPTLVTGFMSTGVKAGGGFSVFCAGALAGARTGRVDWMLPCCPPSPDSR